MAKLTGPLLSFGARGQIGKTLVAGDWKGVKYARQYTIPANPQTAGQTNIRSVFSTLQSLWLNSPTLFRAPWTANAIGRKYTDRNKLVAENLPLLKAATDMDSFIASPGAMGGPPIDSVTAVTGSGSGEIDTTTTVPSAPTGWTLASVTFVAFPDQDPHDAFVGPMVAISDNGAPFIADFTGLTPATDYQVCAWPVWTRPDGKTAYGQASSTPPRPAPKTLPCRREPVSRRADGANQCSAVESWSIPLAERFAFAAGPSLDQVRDIQPTNTGVVG